MDQSVYFRRLYWFQEGPWPTWKEVKKLASSGEEHLLSVIKERKNMPYIVRCKEYYRDENQIPCIEEIPVATAPDKLKPTMKVQNYHVSHFSKCQKYVSMMKTHPDKKVIPFEYDQHYRGWKKFFKTHKPALSRVIGLNRKELDRGLKMLLKLLTKVKHGETIEPVTGQWLFTFLVCLQPPFLADTCAVLRDIARQCAEIRSHIATEYPYAALLAVPLNLFICVVGRCFGQYDLAD